MTQIKQQNNFAGTGKSVLLEALQTAFLSKKLKVAMTATTGMAATIINGTTLHRFLGITNSSLPAQQLADLAVQDQHTFHRIT